MSLNGVKFSIGVNRKVLTPGVFIGHGVTALFEGRFYQVWHIPKGNVYSHQGAPWLYTPLMLVLVKFRKAADKNMYEVIKVVEECTPGRKAQTNIKRLTFWAGSLDALALQDLEDGIYVE